MSDNGSDSNFEALEEAFIESDAALASFLERLNKGGHKVCGVDTEADSLHSYREKLCLVQMSCGGVLAVIDPLKISEPAMHDLVDFWHEREVWFHGADFDMTLLQRTFGKVPERILDTQLAARLVGREKFGLANLIEAHFSVQLSKSSQKADWGGRPLREKMLKYAYDDVRYLLTLAEQLSEELHRLERWTWFEEWCGHARRSVLDRKERPADEVWRVSGWGNLDRRQLAFLRELWLWRDAESERLDLPPFKVMNNQQLLGVAVRAASGQEVRGAKGLRPEQSRRFREALAKAEGLNESEWPRRRLSRGAAREEVDAEAYAAIRKRRDAEAARLGLDPTIIATRSTMEALANRPESAEDLLMGWQRELLQL